MNGLKHVIDIIRSYNQGRPYRIRVRQSGYSINTISSLSDLDHYIKEN